VRHGSFGLRSLRTKETALVTAEEMVERESATTRMMTNARVTASVIEATASPAVRTREAADRLAASVIEPIESAADLTHDPAALTAASVMELTDSDACRTRDPADLVAVSDSDARLSARVRAFDETLTTLSEMELAASARVRSMILRPSTDSNMYGYGSMAVQMIDPPSSVTVPPRYLGQTGSVALDVWTSSFSDVHRYQYPAQFT
jgi:hypothetical protein